MASRFWIGGSGTWNASTTTNWAATSGGAGGQSVPGASDDVTFDASSGGGTVTVGTGYNPSVTSITMGAFTGTLDFSAFNNSPTMATFDCSGAATKTLNMGSGTWTITGNNAVIFTFSTNTNATINYGTSTVNCTYAGSVGTRQVILGSGVSNRGQLYNFKVSAGTDTFVLTASGSININGDLDYTGFAGTETGLVTGYYYGNFTLSTGMTVSTNSASVMTFLSTSGTKTINTFNKSLNFPVTFDGVGGTWQLGNDFTIGSSRTLTLTNGTFNANNFNVTCGIFSSSNSNVRTLTMGSGTWTLTGNNALIWNTSTTTGLTLNADTSTVDCNYSGSTGTRSLQLGTGVILNNLKVSAGSDIFTFNTSPAAFSGNMDWTGFTGSWTNTGLALSVGGNFTLGTGMTTSANGTGIYSLTSTTTCSITMNGVTMNHPMTINGVGGVFTLQDNFTLGGTAANLVLNSGTFNANNKNISVLTFNSSNSNTRTLTMGTGTWTLTGTGTVWDTGTNTNLTFNSNTSTVLISDISASTKQMTIGGAGTTFYNVAITGGTGSGSVTLFYTTNRNFNNISILNPSSTLIFNNGSTTVAGSLSWTGTAGNLNSVISNSAGTPFTISVASGTVSQDYISLKDSTATGGATFYAGANSTNVSGNTGWTFTADPNAGTRLGRNTISTAIVV